MNEQGQDLLKVLNPKGNCQMTTTKNYGTAKDFCSNSIYLNSDSTFLKEGGCEGHSSITLGEWKIVGDSLELRSLPMNKINLVCNVELSQKISKLFKSTFTFTDKTGKPIRHFIILPLKNNEEYTFTSNPSVVFNSEEKYVEVYETDNKGNITVDISKCDTLEFSQLKMLTGNKYRFASKNLPDTIRITLNINAYGLYYANTDYKFLDNPIRFKFSEDKLTNGVWTYTSSK